MFRGLCLIIPQIITGWKFQNSNEKRAVKGIELSFFSINVAVKGDPVVSSTSRRLWASSVTGDWEVMQRHLWPIAGCLRLGPSPTPKREGVSRS